jgi:hypothetical protein
MQRMKQIFKSLILLFLLILPFNVFGSDTLYERFNNNSDNDYFEFLYGNNWYAQTFTVGETGTNESHYDTSFKMLIYKASGATGTIEYAIRATDTGAPTGDDLCSGTADVTTISTTKGYFEISLSGCNNLTPSGVYAVVISCQTCIVTLYPRVYNGVNNYTGGGMYSSSDAGINWTIPGANVDWLFEEYGLASTTEEEPPPVAGETDFNFPELLISLFAVFILCFIINKGTEIVPKKIKDIYSYRIK